MTDHAVQLALEREPTAVVPKGPTAGALLRAARESQGLHIEALASVVKVPARKLEALEADRLDELPDIAFTRGLAQAVARALRIDAQPVLALLPRGRQHAIERVGDGLNMPFRERSPRNDGFGTGRVQRPFVWGAALLVVAAAAVLMWPAPIDWSDFTRPDAVRSQLPDARSAAGAIESPLAASAPVAAPNAVVADSTPPPVALEDAAASSGAPLPAVADASLLLHANAQSWVEVVDRNGQTLLSRTLPAGDSVGVDGEPPLRLKIGNAAATAVSFRGQAVDLAPLTRDNVARFELK